MTKLITLIFLAASSVFAQYAPAAGGSTTLSGEINSKPAFQIGVSSGLACTAGKDMSFSGGVWSFCTVTGIPGTWITLPASVLVPANNLSDIGNAATARTNLGLGTAATAALTSLFQLGSGNVVTTGAQDFSAATHLRVPNASGYTPTINGHFGYDTSTNAFKGYVGAAVKTFAFLDSNITGTSAGLSGTPALPSGTTATTQSPGNNTTLVANTAFVTAAVAAGGGGGGSITDLTPSKTSGTVVAVAAGKFKYGTNIATLASPVTFTLQTVAITSIVTGSTTTVNVAAPVPSIIEGQSINVQLVGCAAGTGVFVISRNTTTQFFINADTSGGGCSFTSGTMGAQTGGNAIIFGNSAGQVELSHSASTGAIVLVTGAGATATQTSTGTFPNGSTPIGTVSISAGAWGTMIDQRAFLSGMEVQAGPGINVDMFGGQPQISTGSNIPTTDGVSSWTGSPNFGNVLKITPWRIGTGSPNARDNCTDKGEAYFQTDGTLGLWTSTVVATPCTWAKVGDPNNPTFTGVVTDTGALVLSGSNTPTALSGNVNDYNPSGCATAIALRIDGGVADRNITGLACGTPVDGRFLDIINVGTTNSIILVNQSVSSTAANRFLMPNDVTLPPNSPLSLRYDGTTARWRPWSRALANTGVAAGTYESVTVDVSGRVTAGSTSLLGTGALKFTFDTTAGTCSVTLGTGSCTASATAGNGSVPGIVVTHNFGSTTVWPAVVDSSRIAAGSSSPSASSSVLGWQTDSAGNITTITLAGALAGTGGVSAGGSGPTGAGYKGTSVTSIANGTGSKTVITQGGLAYVVGSCVQIVSAGTPADQMVGPVTAYNSSTGSITITSAARVAGTCSGTTGTGTHADWNVSIAGVSGSDGTGSGTLTSIIFSAPLTGGTISTSGTVGAGGLATQTKCVDFGTDNASTDLVDADLGPQGNIFKIPAAVTVIEASFTSNAGTPSMPILQKNHFGGSSWAATDITSAVLPTGASGIETCAATTSTCLSGVAKSGSVTIVTASSANVLAAGDYIQTKTGSGFASSGAKRGTVCIAYTVN